MAPINNPNGNSVSEIVLPNGATASEVIAPDGSRVFGAIPDSEDFEHNDLTGRYGGEISYFDIQSSRVYEGSYALTGDANTNTSLIVRDTGQYKWGPEATGDIRVTWQQYVPDQEAHVEGLFLATSVTSFSNASGYWVGAGDSDTGSNQLRRVDDGSVTSLGSIDPLPTSSWAPCQLDWFSDGTIEVTIDGSTSTFSDLTYQSAYLGFADYRESSIDNVQFEAL